MVKTVSKTVFPVEDLVRTLIGSLIQTLSFLGMTTRTVVSSGNDHIFSLAKKKERQRKKSLVLYVYVCKEKGDHCL